MDTRRHFLISAPFVGEGGWPSDEIRPMLDLGARLAGEIPIYLSIMAIRTQRCPLSIWTLSQSCAASLGTMISSLTIFRMWRWISVSGPTGAKSELLVTCG